MNIFDTLKVTDTLRGSLATRSFSQNSTGRVGTSGLQIFNPIGSTSTSTVATPKDGYVAFITIYDTEGDKVWLARAPITGVNIKQLADYSVTKALDNDFLVTTFGDTPVQIDLTGMNIYNMNGCNIVDSAASKAQILSYYKKKKISSNLKIRFDISIATGSGGPSSTFRCVLVALNVKNDASSGAMDTGNRLYSYAMTFIGVSR